MKTLMLWLLLVMAFLPHEVQGFSQKLCMRPYVSCPRAGSQRSCSCCSVNSSFKRLKCPGKCEIYCWTAGRPPPPPTPTPTPPPTTPPTTYKPHEERDNMIDQDLLLWPRYAEDSIPTMDEGSDELRVIETSLGQEDNLDQGAFFFRKGRCGKFPQAVSIESKQYAGKFWRHQQGKIKIQGSENTDDICFNVVKADCEDGGFALQAASIPGRFVQKCGDKIELRTQDDNCGDVKNMCWANPVSEQANLASCETKVTTEDDVYEHPECCNHEATLEKFGECCRENITTCVINCPPRIVHTLHMWLRPTSKLYSIAPKIILKYPQCCKISQVKDSRIGQRFCRGSRSKRAPSACNMPCWKLNYCPKKMRSLSNWETTGWSNCCCHPYRKVLIKRRFGYPGVCRGLPG